MLSRLARLQPPLRARPRRTFVSAVLLTRTWENESVASLRKEAKVRGLSAQGSKASLILRISEHEKRTISPPTPSVQPPPSQKPAGARSVTHTVAPGPGVPATAATSAPLPPHQLLNVVLPDISQPDPEPAVQVPYVPDFWDSITLEKQTPSVEEKLPKVLVVSGASTHADNGPLHNLESVSEDGIIAAETTAEQSQPASTEPGLFEDMTQDLGIPPPKELKQSLWKLFS